MRATSALLLLPFCLGIAACAQTGKIARPASVFAGSTPCNSAVNALLHIPPSDACAYMKWELRLTGIAGGDSSFELHVAYGDYLPNTALFLNGGKSLVFTGTLYTTMTARNGTAYRVLHLTANGLKGELLLIELDKHILHMADSSLRLTRGDESFGFILNGTDTARYESVADTSHLIGYFDGRTPCQELAREMRETTTPECWKIKWRLTLWDNGQEHTEGAFALEGFKFRKENILRGHWHLTKGTKTDPNATVYELDLAGRAPLYLLRAEDNVLLFLDSQRTILAGNKNFSYALYKAQ